jgi:hypothetical protein
MSSPWLAAFRGGSEIVRWLMIYAKTTALGLSRMVVECSVLRRKAHLLRYVSLSLAKFSSEAELTRLALTRSFCSLSNDFLQAVTEKSLRGK